MRATFRLLAEQRWTVAAFAVAGFSISLLQSIAFFRLAGHSFADRAAFGYGLSLEAPADAPLFAPPVHPETVGGYLEFRALGLLAILFAAWGFASAIRPAAEPAASRALAFAISATVAAAAACAGILVGVGSGGESAGALGLVEAGLLLVALANACFAICLVVAQLAPRAAWVTAGLLLALFFVNSLGRIFTQLSDVRWLSPFRYYDLSTPLAPGGRFDLAGFAVLVVVALAGVAAPTLGKRAPTSRPVVVEPSRATLLTFPVSRELYLHRFGFAAWSIAFITLAVILVAATRTSMQDILSVPQGLPGVHQYVFVFYAQTLDSTWFQVALLMSVALVITSVVRWDAEDRNGQLEAKLSTPYSRPAVIVERVASLALTAVVLAAVSGVVVALMSSALNLKLDTSRLVAACVLLVFFTVVLASAGLLFASWLPRASAALIGWLVLASYLDAQIGAGLALPGWLQNLSPFRLVGEPLANGLDSRNLAVLALLVVAGLGSSILAMQRRDVGAQ